MFWGFEGKVQKMIATGKSREAADILRQRIGLSQKPKARDLNFLAVCETNLGHPNIAHDLLTEALEISPRDSHALNNLGNLAFIMKDTQTARDYYLRSLRENVWAVEPRHNLTVVYQHIGHSEKALSAYEDYIIVLRVTRWARIAIVSIIVLVLLLASRF